MMLFYKRFINEWILKWYNPLKQVWGIVYGHITLSHISDFFAEFCSCLDIDPGHIVLDLYLIISFFGANITGIVILISNSTCSLLMRRKAIEFMYKFSILWPFNNGLLVPGIFFFLHVLILFQLSTCIIMSFVRKDSVFLIFLSVYLLFPCLAYCTSWDSG